MIDTGSSVLRYCVALDAPSVSGLRVIELAAEQHGVSYSLGYQGQAVCMLAGVGSDEEECFQGGEPFWGYWRTEGSGAWSWSGTGAGGSSVEDGDVEGWAWGTGNDGGSHPAPPATTHASVCGVDEEPDDGGGGDKDDSTDEERPDEKPKGSRSRSPSAGKGPGSAAPIAPADIVDDPQGSKGDVREKKERSPRKRDARERRNETSDGLVAGPPASPSTSPPAAATGTSDPDGPPAVGIVALLLTIGLAIAGAWFVKRKQMPSR